MEEEQNNQVPTTDETAAGCVGFGCLIFIIMFVIMFVCVVFGLSIHL